MLRKSSFGTASSLGRSYASGAIGLYRRIDVMFDVLRIDDHVLRWFDDWFKASTGTHNNAIDKWCLFIASISTLNHFYCKLVSLLLFSCFLFCFALFWILFFFWFWGVLVLVVSVDFYIHAKYAPFVRNLTGNWTVSFNLFTTIEIHI